MLESKPPLPEPSPAAAASDPPGGPQLWTYREVAALCRVTLQTVQEWVKRGRIPSPIYFGFTARFTADQVADIMCGAKPPGSYTPAPSARAEIGALGGSSTYPQKHKSRNPSQQKMDAAKAKKARPKARQKTKASIKKKPTTTKKRK